MSASRPPCPILLPALLLAPTCCLGAAALAADTSAEVQRLEEVTVTATRLPRRPDEIAGTVTALSAADLQRQAANALDDLTRYQPGLSMEGAARGGNQGFSIRGIGGNRVLMLVDGLRSADIYAAGPSSYGKDMFEVDDLQAVEIIRGPASVLYGADALGGAVLLRTKDPRDYLEDGRRSHVGLRSSWAGDRDLTKTGLTLVGQRGSLGSLLQFTGRRFGEREVAGPGSLNPQDGKSDDLLWKSVWEPDDAQRLSLTLDFNRQETDTVLLNELGAGVASSTGRDTSYRRRIALDYTWRLDAAWADSLQAQAAWQDSDGRQHSEQLRTSYAFVDPRNPASARGSQAARVSDFQFNQENLALSLLATRAFELAGAAHTVVYGLSLELTDTARPRHRCDTEVASGRVSCAIPSYPFAPPEIFPNKTFPDTRSERLGLFAQDELRLTERLTLIPGLRYNQYRMDPKPDALLNGSGDISRYGGFTVSEIEEHEVSFSAGLLYALGDSLSLFAQYAEGFRPPNFDESNQAFVNLGHGYATIPNPALHAESSRSYEAGLRGTFARWNFSVSAYHNRYHDFIEAISIGTLDGISLFQDANIGQARIQGLEAEALWLLGERWSWRTALAWSRGENALSGAPLDSVAPFSAVTGLRFQGLDGRLELEALLSLAAEQNRVSAPDRVRGEAWQSVDLLGTYRFNERASLRLGLFNLFDAQYAPWSSLQGLAADDSRNIANAAMPGTNARLALDYRF